MAVSCSAWHSKTPGRVSLEDAFGASGKQSSASKYALSRRTPWCPWFGIAGIGGLAGDPPHQRRGGEAEAGGSREKG